MNAKASDDTEYDIPRQRSITMDKGENTAIIQSTTQRLMAKAHPITFAMIPILLTGILIALVSIYTGSLVQPGIDAAQDTHLKRHDSELSEVKGELKAAVKQLTELNTQFAVLLVKLDKND